MSWNVGLCFQDSLNYNVSQWRSSFKSILNHKWNHCTLCSSLFFSQAWISKYQGTHPQILQMGMLKTFGLSFICNFIPTFWFVLDNSCSSARNVKGYSDPIYEAFVNFMRHRYFKIFVVVGISKRRLYAKPCSQNIFKGKLQENKNQLSFGYIPNISKQGCQLLCPDSCQ